MDYRERLKQIVRGLILIVGEYPFFELRVPKSEGGPLNGLFDDLDKAARVAMKLTGKVPGIYCSLNPVKKSIASRVTNDLRKTRSAVKDADIDRRVWLPIDFDAIRTPDTPSTAGEHEAALALARECSTSLSGLGWPDPILANSGNGAHLLYRIDLPNDRPSSDLVRDCLQMLSLKFSTAKVSVDIGNFNASRIWRVYGTLNCKGEKSDARPHRRAGVLKLPGEIEVVNADQLNALASMLPASSKDNEAERLDVSRWVEQYKVPVVADSPWNNGGHRWTLQCPWDESHKNASAFIVQFADGGIAAGCLHQSCAGKNWPALRAQFEQRSGAAAPSDVVPTVAQPEKLVVGPKATQAKVLLQLSGELELFCTPQGVPYATVQIKNHRETHLLSSKAFERLLRFRYFELTKSAPKPREVPEAVSHFDAVARFDSPRKPVFVRVAEQGQKNYLDLADDRWRAVEFGADGWRIVETPSVKFRRAAGMLPLPTPVPGGDINELKTFLNLRTNDDWYLLIANLVQALLARGPYTVLGLHGEAGSAKSTGGRILRGMIDPNSSPARAMPRDDRDLMITANNSWVLLFDNLSYLPAWFSDGLCRLATGSGLATRQLYSDADETLFEGQRPIILNGIEELASRTDLLDRSLILDLPLIENYREERLFWRQFEAAHPRLLGALLDLAVNAIRKLPTVQLQEKPRLADFAVLGTATESALGLRRGAFMNAFDRNRQDANAVALEASPIANLIRDLAEERHWEGTAQDLLRKLSTMAEEEIRKRRNWPKTPRMLAGMLRRLATALRRAGVEVQFSRENTAERTRKITIKRREK